MPKREMLINYAPGQECRIAIVEDGRLEEFYQERASAESHVGNIYKGRVVHIEPAIQAAFVDFGLERNGFLHLTDLHPMYFGSHAREDSERVGQKTPHRERPPIQQCLRRGQDILVQVLKEGIGTKGPTLTSYLSIPGRFLVMLPFMERMGVSRKIDDDEARREIRELLDELAPPKDFGFIIRTAGIGRIKTDLKRDLAYLQRLWKVIEQRRKNTPGVGELYAEADLVIRTIRDVFSSDIERVIIDDVSAARRAQNFLSISNPRAGSQVMVYRDPVPLFDRFDIESQIENINARTVPLRSGGSLVIDSTEALVAIDVNSGKSRESRDAEGTAFHTNMEAADEVCRQLRLRDLGGVVVIDLIDMRALKNRREIEGRFRENLKKDRARTHISPISQFGILEMTRQRMRPSLKTSLYTACPACQGAGQVKSTESVVLDVMRRLALALYQSGVARAEITISPDVAFHLLNRKRSQLVSLEQRHGKTVTVRVGGTSLDFIQLVALDSQGNTVPMEPARQMSDSSLQPLDPDPDGLQDELQDEPQDEPSPEADATPAEETGAAEQPASQSQEPGQPPKSRRRRRRRRGGRGGKPPEQQTPEAGTGYANNKTQTPATKSALTTPVAQPPPAVKPTTDGQSNAGNENPTGTNPPQSGGRKRRRRRRGRGRGKGPQPGTPTVVAAGQPSEPMPEPI